MCNLELVWIQRLNLYKFRYTPIRNLIDPLDRFKSLPKWKKIFPSRKMHKNDTIDLRVIPSTEMRATGCAVVRVNVKSVAYRKDNLFCFFRQKNLTENEGKTLACEIRYQKRLTSRSKLKGRPKRALKKKRMARQIIDAVDIAWTYLSCSTLAGKYLFVSSIIRTR